MPQPNKVDVRTQFGDQLRRLRTERGISQETLAAKAGLDRTYISGCERGQRNISLVNIYKISDALGISPTELFGNPKKPPRRNPDSQ